MRVLAALAAGFCLGVAVPPARCDSPLYEVTDLTLADDVEFAWVGSREHDGAGDRRSDGFELVFPLGERWEAAVASSIASRGHGPRHSALGDTEVAVKVVVLAETEAGAALGLEPTLILPAGLSGAGEGVVQFVLPLAASKVIGRYRLTAQLAYARSGREDHAPMSILAERALGDRWWLGAEVAADASLQRGGGREAEVNLGGVWRLRDGVGLHGLIGRAVAGGAGTHSRMALIVDF